MTSSYNVSKEPYYDYFIKNGYSYLGHGYMHTVFEKDDFIYKLVQSTFSEFNDVKNYEFEKYNLDTLRKYLPTAEVVHIYNKGELVNDFCVLKEKKIHGIIKNKFDLNVNSIKSIYNLLLSTHKIEIPYFGQTYDKSFQFNTWKEYLGHSMNVANGISENFKIETNFKKIESYFSNEYNYTDKAKFLALDPNEKNYFFNKKDEIIGVIDIDHPIAFDPLYEFAGYMYSRPDIFNCMNHELKAFNTNSIRTIRMYAIIYALYDLSFRSKRNNGVADDKIKVYITNATNFIKAQERIK